MPRVPFVRLISFLGLALNSLLLAQGTSTFRSDVSLVGVEADVREGGGPVAGLVKEDFRIFDNGKPQTLLTVGHEEVPLEIVLLLDARPSMLQIVAQLANAAHSALGELRSSDRVAVMAFTGSCETTLISGFANDATVVEEGIQSHLRAWQQGSSQGRSRGCQTLQALRSGAQLFQVEQSSNRRRAIVAITDDRGSGTAGELVRNGVRDLWNANAVVLSLNLKSGLKEVHMGAFRGARYAADRTGGEAIEFDDVREGIRDAIRGLRSRYSLYYALPLGKPGEERRVRVELAGQAGRLHKEAAIRSRDGYVMPPVPGNPAR